MLRLIKIRGDSLLPDFIEGDFVLISKIPFLIHSVNPGDVVVFRTPEYGTLIKKIERIDHKARAIYVVGNHPQSVDSRWFGWIDYNQVMGKVIWRIAKLS